MGKDLIPVQGPGNVSLSSWVMYNLQYLWNCSYFMNICFNLLTFTERSSGLSNVVVRSMCIGVNLHLKYNPLSLLVM